MKLYSGPLSLFTAKVRIALDEKQLAYERIEVGWSLAKRYEPHHPDVVALNPKRQVPVLVDGDVVVYDSTVILEYLEDRYPEPAALPARRDRARALPPARGGRRRALVPAALGPDRGRVLRRRGRTRATPRASTAGRAALTQRYDALDKELAGREFLCGAFSVADIGTFIMVNAAATLGAPLGDAHARVRDWLARTRARPAVRREAEEMGAYAAKVMARHLMGLRSAAPR